MKKVMFFQFIQKSMGILFKDLSLKKKNKRKKKKVTQLDAIKTFYFFQQLSNCAPPEKNEFKAKRAYQQAVQDNLVLYPQRESRAY